MHLFLYIQYSTPDMVPFLNGESYSVIPQLLIPRIFLPGKVTSHFGNQLLALHYGISDNEEDVVTSVGFGLICEAFANFGYLGCVIVPILLGAAAGSDHALEHERADHVVSLSLWRALPQLRLPGGIHRRCPHLVALSGVGGARLHRHCLHARCADRAAATAASTDVLAADDRTLNQPAPIT